MPLPTPRGLPFVRAELCVLWLAWLAGWKWPSGHSQKKLQSSPDGLTTNSLHHKKDKPVPARESTLPTEALQPQQGLGAATAGPCSPRMPEKG